MILPVILLIVLVAILIVVYLIKRIQLAAALKKVAIMLEKHEEKVFIEEIKQLKNRNFLEKANGKDERV